MFNAYDDKSIIGKLSPKHTDYLIIFKKYRIKNI